MVDILSPEQRRRCMSAVHSRDTGPELIVRRYLHSLGFRYRLNHPRLPGHPDIVLRRYRTAVFVNGCFWHGHAGCRYYHLPKTNSDFWQAKVERNRARDTAEQQRLAAMGWHTIVVWECQLRPAVREQTLANLAFTLNSIYLADHSLHRPAPYAAANDDNIDNTTHRPALYVAADDNATDSPLHRPEPYDAADDDTAALAADEQAGYNNPTCDPDNK